MIDSFLQSLGYGLCHQLPERSFFGGGVQAPVCARDTGIYLGFVVSLLVITVLHRLEKPREFPRPFVWIFFAACIGFMGWDGITSYAGWRESSNLLRLMSGLGAGFTAAAVIAPMLNDTLLKNPGRGRLFDPGVRFWLWVLAIPVSGAFFWWLGPRFGVFYPVLIAVSIVATLTAINLVLVGMLPLFDRRAERMRDLIVPIAIGLLIGLAEIWGAALLRGVLVRLAASAA